MEAIFSAVDLSQVLSFIVVAGLVWVGVDLIFKAVDFVKSLLFGVDSFRSSDVVYCDSPSSFSDSIDSDNSDSSFVNFPESNDSYLYGDSLNIQSHFDDEDYYSEFNEDDFQWLNPDFESQLDWDSEKKYSAFESIYYDYRYAVNNPSELAWESFRESSGGLTPEEFFEQNQDNLNRYRLENPEQFADEIEFNFGDE